MIEKQLQAEDQQVLDQDPTALSPEEEINEYLDGTVDTFTDFTQQDKEQGTPPTDAQLQGAAEMYNMAMATNSAHITPDDVLQMVDRDLTPQAVAAALDTVQGQNAETRKSLAYSLIGDPRLTIEAKMDLLRYVDQVGQERDVNMVGKGAQSAAAATEYADDDEPDSAEALAMHNEAIVRQPANVEVSPDSPEQVYFDLQELYKQADNQESFLDYAEQMTPVGSLPALNKVVYDIYNDLGLNTKGLSVEDIAAWGMVGTAFQDLRNLLRSAEKNPEQRADIARTIYKRLKQNTGVLQDQNDLVVMQVIENLFSKEVAGTDPYAYEVAPEAGERTKLEARASAIQGQLALYTDPRAANPKLQAELVEIQKKLGGVGGTTFTDNVFNLLDWTVAGAPLKFLGRKIRGMPKLLEGMSQTAPEVAAKKAAAGMLDESEEIVARMGTTKLDLAENFLASGSDDAVLNRGVNGFAAMTEAMRDQARALVNQITPTNLTAAERGKALNDISQKYSPDVLAKSHIVKLHLNQSSVQLTEDGTSAAITGIFGATPYRGYATLHTARTAGLTAIEEVFGKGTVMEVVTKGSDGLWKVVDSSVRGQTRGEFFQRVKEVRNLGAWENYGTIGLVDNAVDKLTLSSGAAHWTRGLNIFNDFHYDQISARVRQSTFSNTVWRGLIRPLSTLKTNQKQLLSKIIRDNEGKELLDDELEVLAGGDRHVMDGYRRFNQIGNIAYHLEDQLKRNAYIREGLSDLYQNGQRIGFGKTMEQASALKLGPGKSTRKVFDPGTGMYTDLSPDDIAKLYKKGGALAKMKHPVRGSENLEDVLVLLDRSKGGKQLPIPAFGVQARIPGYYPHMYNKNFIVYAVDKAGKKIPRAVSFTQKSASSYVAKKNAQLASLKTKGKAKNLLRYEVAYDAALHRGDLYAQHLDEVESGFSQIMFGQRSGSNLRQLDNMIEEAELDPIAAMLRATEVLSTRMTKGEMLQSMRLRTWNYLHLPENQKYLVSGALKKSYNQLSVDDLVKAHPDMKNWKQAHAMLHRIRVMEQSPDFWENVTKGAYRQMAQLSNKLGVKTTEMAAYRATKAGPNPISLGLGWLHRMYISAFAIKQFTLQVLQSTATAGMLHPGQYTRSIRQAMTILPAVIFRTAKLHGGNGFLDTAMRGDEFWSKAAGLSKKEFDRLTDIIIERGLIDSVGSNTMVKAAINDAAEQSARKRAGLPRKGVPEAIEQARDKLGPLSGLTRARNWDQLVFGTLNKVGWEGGERINQILSMLTLYNADKAKGVAKLADAAYVDSLIGRTADITGNMVKEAGFGYTNSVLKPFMLWVPFQHKMILQAMPKSFGGMKRFTANEKARMVFGQFLLYGANATAITAAVHQGIERGIVENLEAQPDGDKNGFVQFWRDNMTKDVLEGMVFDWMGNKVMQALWGNDADTPDEMAWGRAFAPGAGHEFVREKITALASADWKGALGVQGNYYSRLARYMGDVSNVVTARMKDADDMPFEQRMDLVVKRGLVDTMPIYGKWVAGRWASEHGRFISERGVISEPFGDAIEVRLQWLFGVESKDRASYYEATDRLRLDFEDTAKADKAAEEIADIYWKNLLTTAVKLNTEAPTDDLWQGAMDQWMLDQGLMLSVLGPREKQVFSARIERKIDELATGQGDSAEKLMMEKFTGKLREGGYGEEGPKAAIYFKHLPFVQKSPVFLDMIEAAWDDIVKEPTPENITEDVIEGEE